MWLEARTKLFLKMARNSRFRTDLRILYIGPALGPLTKAAHNFRAEYKNGALQIPRLQLCPQFIFQLNYENDVKI